MDPTITAALVYSAANLFEVFIEVWKTSRQEDSKQRKVKKWISDNYETLRASLSSNSVRLLKAVDVGKRLRVGDFSKILYSEYELKEKYFDLLKDEFHYRIQFLVLIGVLRHLPQIGRYEITRLGVAFQEEARAKKDYRSVLLQQ